MKASTADVNAAVLSAGGVAHGAHQLVALRQQGPRQGTADEAGGAGDEDGISHQRSVRHLDQYFTEQRQRAQKITKLSHDFRMSEREFNGGLQIALLGAAVIALAFELIRQHRFAGEQLRNAIGQLQLAAGTRTQPVQMTENRGRQYRATNSSARMYSPGLR